MTDSSPFSGLVSIWLSKIEMAWDQKNKRYGKDARDGMFFYSGPYDRMYENGGAGPWGASGRASSATVSMIPPPAMRLTLNRVADIVQLFGPFLYYKNPNRQVTPRKQVATTTDLLGAVMNSTPQYAPLMQQLFMLSQQQNAQDAALSDLVESLLNATPTPLDLKTQSRMAIDEALISGLGLLWTTKFLPPGAQTPVVGSFFGTQADLLIDPDATSWQNAQWIARRTISPVWEAERRWQLPPGTLKANIESNNRQGEIRGMGFDGVMYRTQGRTCDMVIYYEVWSKCGLGSRLKGANDTFTQQATEGIIGDYAYIVVSPEQQFPLNAGPQLMSQPSSPEAMQSVTQAFSWETPFYVDGGWPCVPLAFHDIPNDPWPASHISFALGILKLINWIGSWATERIRTSCRTFIVTPKRLADEFKQMVQSGGDLSLLELTEEYKDAREAVQFIQQMPANTDMWQIIEMLEGWFDKATGLSELMYGQSNRQYRSAAEAEIKKDQANIRPEDMANRVEDWQSLIARREAFASRWHLQGNDVMPFLGKPGAALWQMLVVNQDPASMLYDLQYRVEAGSIRKPNRSRDAENATALMQNVMPIAIQYFQMTGNIDAVNQILALWKKSMDIDQSLVNFAPLMMPGMGPTLPPGAPAPEPGKGGAKGGTPQPAMAA